MKITQTPNELVVKETPGCIWVIGLFFALVGGIFVYGAIGGFTNWNKVPGWQLILTGVMGTIAVLIGYWVIYQAPVLKVIVDRIEDKVSVSRFGLFGKDKKIYSFGEIKEFCLIEERDDENEQIWYVGLNLTSGETVKLTSHAKHSEDERKYVFETNEFMRKQMPSYNKDLLE